MQFDIGVVLEALKERGDVVSKIAYGDWTRAGDYSRSLTQHATKLVQRNLTPGGDKNGADINLALDALEMAFTHGHINAYVIVGGDSDFISLVEKLKQYDKQIFVVGGRAFTSLVMQRNCHEFIAYENLVSSRRFQDRGAEEHAGDDAAGAARSGGAARAPRAQGADRSRGHAAARPAQEHAPAARFHVLRAHVWRGQLPRFRAEACRGGARRIARGRPQRPRRAQRQCARDLRRPFDRVWAGRFDEPLDKLGQSSEDRGRASRRRNSVSRRARGARRGGAGQRQRSRGRRHPRDPPPVSDGAAAAALADVHPSVEAVSPRGRRRVRRAQVRVRDARRSRCGPVSATGCCESSAIVRAGCGSSPER